MCGQRILSLYWEAVTMNSDKWGLTSGCNSSPHHHIYTTLTYLRIWYCVVSSQMEVKSQAQYNLPANGEVRVSESDDLFSIFEDVSNSNKYKMYFRPGGATLNAVKVAQVCMNSVP
ncbi:hypothetical protein ElyMa_001094600 [Elysia marginata]|uniref:Uncharacterized protein n=1 Tax=Elysia marginata TaxID=1093978 RepID=A0AAV4HU84_9GAST|nr:hypothetical protein ElyMa_001094600 [Elysia marginata]